MISFMKILIQRVTHARVEADGIVTGAVDRGVLILIGFTHEDTPEQASRLAHKSATLRIFEDEEGKINRSLLDIRGEALVVSQFTLYADCSTGRRPSFTKAAPPETAKPLYERFVEELRKKGIGTETGIFGARMEISLINDGPFTVLLEC